MRESMSKYRILAVDDDPEILDLISQSLEPRYEVITASNGLDAIEKLDRVEPDFIILDISMPLMDGFQTCEALRKNHQYGQTPIYFLTSSSSHDDIKRGYELGCNLYLQKPFDPVRLMANIDFFFEKNSIPVRIKKFTKGRIAELDKGPAPVQEPARIPHTSKTAPSTKKQPLQTAPPQSDISDPKRQPVRVMLIDDNEEMLSFATLALQKHDTATGWVFQPIPATNPIEALNNIVRYQPDIIVLDIRMPRLDGINLCKIIKLNQNLKDTEIQFITGMAEPKEVKFAETLTGNPVLKKPFDMSQLRDALVRLCGKIHWHLRLKNLSFEEIQLEITEQKARAVTEVKPEVKRVIHEKPSRPDLEWQ